MTIQEKAREIMQQPLVFGRFFEKPRCKPWDIVKGRRLPCCHGLGGHTQWCPETKIILSIPKFSSVSAEEL